jgi:proteasome lid subunit RPN8/RPN11
VNELVLPAAFYNRIQEEAVAAYPNECCGMLFGRDVKDGDVMRRIVESIEAVRNVFEKGEQYHRFSVDPLTQLKAEKAARARGQDLIGFYHSHPDHPARPSEYDREHAWPFYSYVIVSVMNREPDQTTSWVLDEATNKFKEQEILGTLMNDE